MVPRDIPRNVDYPESLPEGVFGMQSGCLCVFVLCFAAQGLGLVSVAECAFINDTRKSPVFGRPVLEVQGPISQGRFSENPEFVYPEMKKTAECSSFHCLG